jgi:hypothetical protein
MGGSENGAANWGLAARALKAILFPIVKGLFWRRWLIAWRHDAACVGSFARWRRRGNAKGSSMKGISAKSAVVAVIAVLGMALSSCGGGGLSGTYNAAGGSFSGVLFNNEPLTAVEFKSFGNAVITTGGFGTSTYEDGSYKISDGQIILKAEWNYTDKAEGTYSFSESGNTVTIGGHEFSKN